MNAPELQALRRLLFFSVAEAARFLAADEARPNGVEERTWNRWESGKVAVPDNIAATVRQAAGYRAEFIDTVAQAVQDSQAQHGSQAQLCIVWYAELEDWPHPPLLWRPQQSAVAAVVAEQGDACRLVAFDAAAFNRWRLAQGMADGPDARAAWASQQP